MDFLSIYLTIGLVILGLMTMLWLLSLALKNASIVDIFWGTGFVITAWVGFFLTPEGFLARKLLLCALVTIWGLRLSIHILIRNGGKPEDFRYQSWRKENGSAWWWRSFVKVFLLQGLLMWLISTPLLAAQVSPQPAKLTWLDYLAVLLWVYGFFFEAVGDSAQGWAYFLIALAAGAWWAVSSPIMMTLLLMRVSGVTLLEKTLKVQKPG